MSSSTEVLTAINLDDLVSSFGWQERPLLAWPLRRLFLKPARTFAEQMVEFDAAVGAHGLPAASQQILRHYVRSVRVHGAERIPNSAFLALSNHPGMTDTLSLFSAFNRPDLKIIALDRPFLNALPNMSKSLFYLRDDPAARMSMVRAVTGHLRAGGAALTFPAGQIEPDPDVYPGAVDSLRTWTDSAGVFLRLAPESAILPVLVRAVVWRKAARHPLLVIKRTKAEKERLAAALQLLGHVAFRKRDVYVTVHIGRPITTPGLGSADPSVIHEAVLAEMKHLIEHPPEDEGLIAL